MSADQRREKILNLLSTKEQSVTGSNLAEKFGVSRQVIVQDIALLRAEGAEILATSKGYIISKQNSPMSMKTVACKHNRNEIRDELETVIKYGGRVKDVMVEHPIYGELKGCLMIQSKEDLNEFMKKYDQDSVKPLLTLTEGVHLHTIEALNEEVLNLITRKLEQKGYLLE